MTERNPWLVVVRVSDSFRAAFEEIAAELGADLLEWSPAEGTFPSAGSVATVRVWDVANGKQIHAFEGDDAGFASVAVTTDGKHVIAGCRDFTIRAWNLETGDAVATLRTSLPVTHRLALSPDNAFVLTGGGYGANREDFALRLWSLPRPIGAN